MTALATEIRSLPARVDDKAIAAQVRAYLDSTYPSLASLNPQPDHSKRASWTEKRTLVEDIAHWERKEAEARARLEAAEVALPGAIAAAVAALTDILERAQAVTLERYALSDAVAALLAELSSSAPRPDDGYQDDAMGDAKDVDEEEEEASGWDLDDDEDRPRRRKRGPRERTATLLESVEATHAALDRSQAALAWSSVLERMLKLRDTTLDPSTHTPSPLAALPRFQELHATVAELEGVLPAGMALLDAIRSVRADTWAQLRVALGVPLLAAADAIKWPQRIDYPSLPTAQRRAFERAFAEMLYFQGEGERLGICTGLAADWTTGEAGLYPIQTLVKPIELRFRYHFMGSRNTNRVDKPEWGFANISDMVYEHEPFIRDYLQPLTAAAGFASVDVKSEFTMLLFPILLRFLRMRIPHLLKHPALLAHTVYQTVLFDDTVRESGFDLTRTSLYRGAAEAPEWEGLTGVILREEDWFEQWLQGEKMFAETSLNDIISASDAWHISEDEDTGLPTTESARQVRALLEQITDRYAPLPQLAHRVAFLRSVQLPLAAAYHARVASSLDAFETLSSAFVSMIPGALVGGGGPRGGGQTDSRLAGSVGLEKLVKAQVSANYMLAAARAWSNDLLFAEMSADLAGDADAAGTTSSSSVWDTTMEKYGSLRARAEDMMVRLVSAEVEADLKQHLTRRWDLGTANDEVAAHFPADEVRGDLAPSTSLVGALTSYSALLHVLAATLPRPTVARVYRRVSAHLANHITQRAVFAGWSKFTAKGGRALQHEVDDWRSAAAQGVAVSAGANSGSGDWEIPVDAPWSTLAAMANILALPGEAEVAEGNVPAADGDTPTFAQAMAAAWGPSTALDSLKERACAKELDANTLQAVLKRRVECWR